ncbi:MAG: hypothetical protein IKI64_11565 [Clostridia bacterium]|nr:hypothetical protein [Clostridia bacterium]
MSKWDSLHELAQKHRLALTVDDAKAILTDPKTGEHIDILEEKYYPKRDTTTGSEDEAFVEYIVYFSTQHAHFEDLDDALEYVEAIIADEVLPIEFYLNEKRRFGGEITKEDFEELSAEFLASYYGYTLEYLSQFEYEIHSWSGRYNTERKRVE